MKKITCLASVVLMTVILFSGCKKKEETPAPAAETNVVQVQNSLVVEPTATWCGPCGEYGKPATDKAITGNSKVVAIYAHLKAPASDFPSQTGQDLAVIFGAANATGTSYSIPKIAVGNNVTGAFTDINYTANILTGWINATTAQTSKANTKLDASISGNTLNVKANTKFFENGNSTSTYKIALILTEDNISNRQNYSSTGYKTIIHNHVSRATISNATGGDDLLSSGVPTSGQLITKDYSVALDPTWKKADLTVIAIIWKYDGNVMTFVNVDKLELN